jgi:hypothetical protein
MKIILELITLGLNGGGVIKVELRQKQHHYG